MDVFALDFDGVLCDSVAEAGFTAWRAGRKLWPHWQDEEPADAYKRRFISLRPPVETGYQAILLMDLIHQGLNTEIIAAHFAELYEQRIQQTGLSREQLARLFGQTRDEWIARDGLDWFSRHPFLSLCHSEIG
jgi:hypothetical protein